MTFEEFWKAIEQLHTLPDMAIGHVLSTLSNYTKKRLAKMTPEQAVEIIKSVIEEVNSGSTAPLDKLINDRL